MPLLELGETKGKWGEELDSEAALRHSEEKYKELWDKAPISYHTLDINGKILQVNEYGAHMLGFRPEEMIGRPIFDFILPTQREDAERRFRQKIKGEKIPRKRDRIYVKKKGDQIYVSIKDSLIRNRAGEITGVRTTILDYTKRFEAEHALKTSEEKYRKLISNAKDGVIVLNKNSQITLFNQSFCNISGFGKNDLEHFSFFGLVHPDDRMHLEKILQNKFAGKQSSARTEFRIVAKNSATKHISASITTIKEKKKITGIQAVFRDISVDKALQNKIKRSKRNFERIIDTIQNGICVIDRSHIITSCNRTFQRNVGRRMKNIIGQPCHEIMRHYGNGILEAHCSATRCNRECVAESVFRSGRNLSYVETNRIHGKAASFHRITVFPTKNSQGKTYQVVMTIADITELKEAENEYHALSEFNKLILDSAPVSIIALNRKGIIVSANRLAFSIMNKPTDKIIGRRLTNKSNIKKNIKLKNLYENLLEKGEQFCFNGLSFIDRNGKKTLLNIIAVPLLNNSGKIDGAISIANDNTEAAEAKEKLEELNRNLESIVHERTQQLDMSNKKLKEAMELKSKFISDASHELRTPLTVIQGNLEVAIREAENICDLPASETYELIVAEVKRMTVILSDLTMLTNTDSNVETIHRESVSMKKIVRAVLQSLRVLAEQKNISLLCDKNCEKKLNTIHITGDEAKLEKLLINIVRNAIKYTDHGGEIRVWGDMEDGFARIHVKDSGIGIPKEDLPYIFERFYRVDKSRSRAEGGTGLGLSICRWIAEAHNGHIGVESELGKGTTFTVYLPQN